jgi:hypothetical protein
MTTPTASGPAWTWQATFESVRDAIAADNIAGARQLLAKARRPGAVRYRMRERLAGLPRLVTTTLAAIDAALALDEPYVQAARAYVRGSLKGLPEQGSASWHELHVARRELSVARSLARLIPTVAANHTARQQLIEAAQEALDDAGQQLDGLDEIAARLRDTLREFRQAAEGMQAEAQALVDQVSAQPARDRGRQEQ